MKIGRAVQALLAVPVLCGMVGGAASAQGPTVGAVDNGDGTATIQITPDPNFLPGALAVELAVELTGGATISGLGDVAIADPIFDTANPGDSPFVPGSVIGGDANGISTPSSTQIFVAYGSDVVTTPGVIDLFDIDFAGAGFLTLAPNLPETGGDVVAQGGGFNAIVNVGPITIPIGGVIPEPAALALALACVAGAIVRRRG